MRLRSIIRDVSVTAAYTTAGALGFHYLADYIPLGQWDTIGNNVAASAGIVAGYHLSKRGINRGMAGLALSSAAAIGAVAYDLFTDSYTGSPGRSLMSYVEMTGVSWLLLSRFITPETGEGGGGGDDDRGGDRPFIVGPRGGSGKKPRSESRPRTGFPTAV